MEKMINYARLGELVRWHENWIKEEALDLDEQKLLLDILIDRRLQRLNKMRASDMVGNISLGGLFKKIKKQQEGGENELD